MVLEVLVGLVVLEELMLEAQEVQVDLEELVVLEDQVELPLQVVLVDLEVLVALVVLVELMLEVQVAQVVQEVREALVAFLLGLVVLVDLVVAH